MSPNVPAGTVPHKRQRHGLTPAKRAIRKYGTGALDQRTTEARQIAYWKSRLVDDLGGLDAISTQQLTMIELAATQLVLLRMIDGWIFEKPEERVFRRRDRTMYPLTKERQRIADSLARYLAQLGMDRAAPTLTLEAYVEAEYEAEVDG